MIEIEDPLKSYEEYPGPILLLAGPGTGKTFQLAHRVKFIMDELDATPENTCVITFTTAAAKNMRERLVEPDVDLSPGNQPAIISTMHSLGNKILGESPEMVGVPVDYRVLTDSYIRKVLLQDAAYLAAGDRELWEGTDECRRHGACDKAPAEQKCKVCAKYLEILRECSVVDYDDQILLACELLEENEDIAAEWRLKTKHLLVDEYQDINQAQFRLIKLLSEGQTEGLFVVGDDDQSIYSFRGGTPSYIQNFSSHFVGDTRIGRLSKSWRCPENILMGARSIIKKFYAGSVSKPEPSFPDEVTDSEQITFWDVPSESWEGNFIANEIESLSEEDRKIIIIPNSRYLPSIRKALRRKGIPYLYKTTPPESGMVRFALLADWADNPQNNLSLRHILDLIIQNHNDLVTLVPDDDGAKLVDKRRVASNLLATFWADCDAGTPLFDVLTNKTTDDIPEKEFLGKLKIECLDYILSLIKENGGKRAYLPDFLKQSGILLAPGKSAKGIIDEIREWRNEVTEGGSASMMNPVEIYNMPSSKGLEGHVVFVVGATDGLMPNPSSDLEEQARLFYVAMTRAKRKLHVFSSRTRSANITFRGDSFMMKPSPFVDRIPGAHIEIKNIYPKKTRKEGR